MVSVGGGRVQRRKEAVELAMGRWMADDGTCDPVPSTNVAR